MRKQAGFTLIELIITVAILGILTAVAFPYYERLMRKQYRAEAIIAITEQANAQEIFKNANGGFTGSPQAVASSGTLGFSKNSKYQITINISCASGEGDICYKITATAQGTQASDTGCATMTLDHLGRKLPKKCWSS